MSETTPLPEGAQIMPDDLKAAFETIAGYGPATAAIAVEMDDGRTMMVESRTFDVTGWKEER